MSEEEYQCVPAKVVPMEGVNKTVDVRLSMNRGGRQAEIVQNGAYGIQCTMAGDNLFINTSASNPNGAYYMTEEERRMINRMLSEKVRGLIAPEIII